MDQRNHNNPLSVEELLKAIEQKSNAENSFDNFNEFEKDALEGFDAYSTPEKTKLLIDSINKEIALKIQPNETSTSKKNNIIWFSAAAGLALIVVLSIVFFKNESITTNSNLALNEKQLVTPAQDNAPETITSKENNEAESGKISPKEVISISSSLDDTKNRFKTIEEQVPSKNKDSDEKSIAYFGDEEKKSDVALEQNMNQVTSNGSASTTNAGNDADLSSSIKKEKSKPAQTVSTESLNEENDITQKESAKKLAKENNNADKLAIGETKAKEVVAYQNPKANNNVNSNSSTTNNPNSGGLMQPNPAITTENENYKTDGISSSNAYYSSGEIGIKNYILNYYKKTNATNQLKGTFKIKGKVLENGNFVTTSITPISKDYSQSESFLTEALNKMPIWIAATKNNKVTSSNVEFVLIF